MGDERAHLMGESKKEGNKNAACCRFEGFVMRNSFVPKLFGCFYEVSAITLWPWIFIAEGCDNEVLINHEKIHIVQANEMAVIGMYIVWIFDFLRGIIQFGDAQLSYQHNRLEREARMHERDMAYLPVRPAYAWARLSYGSLSDPID
mmetsp:Transcript_34128/g.70506  ORF Transcript_34128/g.70506 Transcript_34128/m.70506 type:complete len:147 (-) Transcript_34128:17-457(-)